MTDHLKNARLLATMMDSQFSLFGIRFGLDALLGLVPGLGDFVSLLLASYLLWIGYQIGLPAKKMVQMIFNLGFDTLIGAVPLIGDIADVFFKANMKNLRILEEHAKNHPVIDAEPLISV